MILTHLYKLIQFAISLIMPSHKPRKEWTIDDVKAALAEKAKSFGEPLDWDKSIVDLCRLLDLNPSLASRGDMYAKAGGTTTFLGAAYTGTAEQNMWLHHEVMESLAKHGFGD